MAIETDLPVFSFRPNLQEPISERLSFLTDILRSSTGAEQRRMLRETPRRTFETDFLLTEQERTFWDLFIDSLGGMEVLVPIYWEVTTINVGSSWDNLDRIFFDTTNREWPYFEGGYAILVGKDAFDYEIVQIADVDDDGIDLTAEVEKVWPGGTKLYPLRPAVIEDYGDLTHKSAAVALATARFRLTGANPWTPAADTSPVYGGLPVLIGEPNWVEDLTVSMARDLAVLDTSIGRTYQVDSMGRSFAVQAHRWFMPGRERLAAFRDLLYRNKGRTGAFWLPTFKADFKLAASALSASNTIEVKNVGFLYSGGQRPGREHIMIRHSAGVIFRKIIDVIPGTTSTTEKLVLDSALGLDLSPGLVRKISFMDTSRFDADDFEITHHGGIDALHECVSSYRAFANTRATPSPINFPIVTQAKNSTPCGTPFTVINPSFESGTSGWSGSVNAFANAVDGIPPFDGVYSAWPGNNANSEFWQDLAVPAIFHAKIDAGNIMAVGFAAWHKIFALQTDHGRLWLSFRNAANIEISRVYTAHDYSTVWTQIVIPDTMVPAGTRIIRFGSHNVREVGTSNDSYWDLFTSGLLVEV